jgi:hypothetical protein
LNAVIVDFLAAITLILEGVPLDDAAAASMRDFDRRSQPCILLSLRLHNEIPSL